MANNDLVSQVLAESFRYYLTNQEELVEAYNGKVIVIVKCQVVGVYDSVSEAYEDARQTYLLGIFLIQKVSPGDKDTTVTIYSPLFCATSKEG